ncbi:MULTISPECIES: hypothetical protein [unclassified Roseobacter]|uniref:hypothetical protein n=1 Tax=unclassified Roseobacter TaxID=196798 RepID=UPI00149138B1|nr:MULTISPECIES: hypothetical protein [unclassified Roseobacter]
MSDLFWLSDARMTRLEPFFPKSLDKKPRVIDCDGVVRLDDRHVAAISRKVQISPGPGLSCFDVDEDYRSGIRPIEAEFEVDGADSLLEITPQNSNAVDLADSG